MRTLDRYIALTFLRNLALSLLALTGIYVFQALLTELLDGTYPARQILFMHALQAPQIVVQLLPPSVLVATVATLAGFSRTNELTAAYSLGIGLGRLMAVVASLVFMICCLSLVLQDRILPPLFRKRTTYYWREMKKKQDFFLDVKQNKIWYRSGNLIYNLRSFDRQTKRITGMSVYTFDDSFKLVQVLDAERALYTPSGWRLQDGTRTVFQGEDSFPVTSPFKERELVIQETPTDFQEIEKEVDGLRIRELGRYIDKNRAAGADTKGYEVRLHQKVSVSFIPLVMCLLGVPFATRGRREGGLPKDLAICLAITFFYWLFYSVGLSLGSNGALPPWLAAWLPSTIFAALAATLIVRRAG